MYFVLFNVFLSFVVICEVFFVLFLVLDCDRRVAIWGFLFEFWIFRNRFEIKSGSGLFVWEAMLGIIRGRGTLG